MDPEESTQSHGNAVPNGTQSESPIGKSAQGAHRHGMVSTTIESRACRSLASAFWFTVACNVVMDVTFALFARSEIIVLVLTLLASWASIMLESTLRSNVDESVASSVVSGHVLGEVSHV